MVKCTFRAIKGRGKKGCGKQKMGEMRLEKKVNALTLGFFVVFIIKITLDFQLHVADYC